MTDGERFIAEQLAGRFASDERLQHTAYLETNTTGGALGALRKKAYWCALTNRRLWLIEARVGAFGALQENRGVEAIERTEIRGAHVNMGSFSLAVAGGRTFDLNPGRGAKLTPGYQGLFDALSEEHGHSTLSTRLATRSKTKRGVLVARAVVVLVGTAIAAYSVLGFGTAEVSIDCTSTAESFVCTATHTKGRADVEACWTVEFHCASGTTIELPACAQVPHGESHTVDLTERELPGLETCEGFTSVEVTNVQVDAQ